MTALAKIWKSLVNNRNLVALLLFGALAIFGVYRGSKWLFGLLVDEPDLSGDISEPMQNQLSFERAYYKGLADAMEEELGSMFSSFGSPTATYAIMDQMISKSDLDQLIISFGTRSNWWAMGDSKPRNLVQWFYRRLSDSQREPIKQKFNSFNIPF